jgi:hypothetical protein
MSRYSGNNLDRIYKAANNSIINSQGKSAIHGKRMRGCLSKAGYDSQFEAEVTAAKRNLRAYKCLYCPHYHLTSRVRR